MFSPLARPHPVPYTRTHTLAFQSTRALSHTVRLHTHSHTHTRTLAHAQTHARTHTHTCGSVPCPPPCPRSIILNSERFDRRPKDQSAVCSSFLDHSALPPVHGK